MKKRLISAFVGCLLLVLSPLLVGCGGNANALSSSNLNGVWHIGGTTTAVTITVLTDQDGILSGTFSGGFAGTWSVEDGNMTASINGTRAVFSPDASNSNPTPTQLDAMVIRLQQMLTANGYAGATVAREGALQIKIEIPGIYDADDLFDAISTPAQLSMNPAGSSDIVYFTNDDIRSAEYTQLAIASYGTVLNFTTAGGDKFWNLLNEAQVGGTIEIWAGDRGNQANLVASPTIAAIWPEMKQSVTIFSATREIAQTLRTRIESGLFEVILQQEEISPTSIALTSGELSNNGRTLSLSSATANLTLVRPPA